MHSHCKPEQPTSQIYWNILELNLCPVEALHVLAECHPRAGARRFALRPVRDDPDGRGESAALHHHSDLLGAGHLLQLRAGLRTPVHHELVFVLAHVDLLLLRLRPEQTVCRRQTVTNLLLPREAVTDMDPFHISGFSEAGGVFPLF